MRTQRGQRVVWMVVVGLLAGVLVGSPSALAQEKAQRQGPCAADVQQFCPEAKTAKERAQCLKSHEAELSQGCKDLRARAGHARSKLAEVREACQTDVETLCRDVKAGRGALLQCLRSHAAELSPACKSALPQGKASVRPGGRGV